MVCINCFSIYNVAPAWCSRIKINKSFRKLNYERYQSFYVYLNLLYLPEYVHPATKSSTTLWGILQNPMYDTGAQHRLAPAAEHYDVVYRSEFSGVKIAQFCLPAKTAVVPQAARRGWLLCCYTLISPLTNCSCRFYADLVQTSSVCIGNNFASLYPPTGSFVENQVGNTVGYLVLIKNTHLIVTLTIPIYSVFGAHIWPRSTHTWDPKTPPRPVWGWESV